MHQSESRSDEKATIRAHRAMRTGSERERDIFHNMSRMNTANKLLMSHKLQVVC